MIYEPNGVCLWPGYRQKTPVCDVDSSDLVWLKEACGIWWHGQNYSLNVGVCTHVYTQRYIKLEG